MKNSKAKKIVTAAVIAALYVVLTYLSSLVGLSSGVIQLRISEMLYTLCLYSPVGIIGVSLGCLLANFLTGAVIWDVIFGTVATLIGAIGTWFLRKYKFPALLCPVLSNTVIIPFVLRYAYGAEDAMWFMFLTVFLGEFISCVVFGWILSTFTDNHAATFR